MNLPIIDMVATVGTTTCSELTENISSNMKIIANTFDNDHYCMSVSTNVPTASLATTIEMLNCSWLNESLDENMDIINKNLKVLNFCGTPTNPIDQLHCSIMIRSLATTHREHELNQDVLHFKPKTVNSLIRSRKIALQDFINLLAKTIAN